MIPDFSLPPVITLGPVPSTNAYALHLPDLPALPEFTVWQTHCQTAGRGQGDNRWESEPGQNITCSILLHPGFLPARNQFELSQTIALAVCRMLGTFTADVTVKWPNDIYVGQRKIAGILIENRLMEKRIVSSVVGIGMNINQQRFLSDAPNPVSLSQLTGETYDLTDMTLRLQRHIADGCLRLRQRYAEGSDGKALQAEYLRHLYRFGTWHPYLADGCVFEGRIAGVTPEGYLQMALRDGTIRQFDLKEIRFLPSQPMARDLTFH